MKHIIIQGAFVVLCAGPGMTTALAQAAPSPVPPGNNGPSQLSRVPVSGLHIGAMGSGDINPYVGDPNAVTMGRKLFKQLNCSGCHAPGGGGGMGPALSDNVWLYGSSPGDIYLSIEHGRPNGMPAWGGALPPQVIWELVTYIKTLQNPPPEYEQGVPAPGGPKPPAQAKRTPPQGPKNPTPPAQGPKPPPAPASSHSAGQP